MRNDSRSALVFVAACAMFPACKGKEVPPPQEVVPPRPRIMWQVPTVGYISVVDTNGTPDAERLTVRVHLKSDSVVTFYRTELPKFSWNIVSVQGDPPAGTTDLYAQKGGDNLWIHVQKRDSLTTEYTLLTSSRETDRGQQIRRPAPPVRR